MKTIKKIEKDIEIWKTKIGEVFEWKGKYYIAVADSSSYFDACNGCDLRDKNKACFLCNNDGPIFKEISQYEILFRGDNQNVEM